MLRAVAPAKVNLFLHILGRRADGYHELQSLVVFTEFGDEVSIDDGEPGEFLGAVGGPAYEAIDPERHESFNSIEVAASRLNALQASQHGMHSKLIKNIPVAAGLGGGSADAAAALRLLNELWNINLSTEELERIAIKIGADVPVCLRQRPTLVGGIGESLREAPALPRIDMVLAHTGEPLPTKSVFHALRSDELSVAPVALPSRFATPEGLVEFLRGARNDLEAPAIRLQPEIAQLLAELHGQPGCVLARMSGSGAACFGLFASEVEAFAASEQLSRLGYWSVATRLIDPSIG